MARGIHISTALSVFLLAGAAAPSPAQTGPAALVPAQQERPLFLFIDRSFLDSEMRLRDRIARGALGVVHSCAAVRPIGVVSYDKGLKVYAEATANETIQEQAVEEAMRHGQVVEGRSRFLSALREAGGPDASGVEDSLRALAVATQTAHGSADLILLGFRMDLFRVPKPHPKYLEAAEALEKAGIHLYAVDYSSNAPNEGFLDLTKRSGGRAEGSNIPGDVPAEILQTLCGR